MSAQAVLAVMDLCTGAGADPWVDGGWGIDALLNEQTRIHSDLDLVIAHEQVYVVRRVLERRGFAVIRSWLPTALALAHPDGREVDLHPVALTEDGGGDQDLGQGRTFHYGPPSSGQIGGQSVRCVNAESQLRAHVGYQPSDKDRADVAALARRYHLRLPVGYVESEQA
jgi:lincosamide nucleotidyltransferase A/C/D/E